jgi:hypothetical protein
MTKLGAIGQIGSKNAITARLITTNSPLSQMNVVGEDIKRAQEQWEAARTLYCGKYKSSLKNFESNISRGSLHFKADYFDGFHLIEFGVLRPKGSLSNIYQKVSQLLLGERLNEKRASLIKHLIMFAPDEDLYKRGGYSMPEDLKETLQSLGIRLHFVTNGGEIYDLLNDLIPF